MKKPRRCAWTRFPKITLAKEDHAIIEGMLRKGRWSARMLRRARILQLLHQERTVKEAGDAVGAYPHTVRQVGWRYLREGLHAALHDRPRPGAERLLKPNEQNRVVAMVCGPPPEGRSRWSVRLVATEAVKRGVVDGVGRETIRVLLAEHDLKPWRKKLGVSPS